MNTTLTALALHQPGRSAASWLRETHAREPRLTVFALLLVAAMLPTLVALGLDDRLLRGVTVWAKPLKFMASVALFALTTAWFVGLLPAARRSGRAVRGIAWTIIGAGTFEIGYITLQAALGEGSHFNFKDGLHVVLYQMMGTGAVAMTATQAVLAWLIAKHAPASIDRTWRDAVVIGLALTFLLGTGAGGLLSAMQPPAGAGLPLVGWHLAGDLRPAHFLGIHAQQLLPVAGALLALSGLARARTLLFVFAAGYVALWVAAMVMGLNGAVLTPMPMPYPAP